MCIQTWVRSRETRRPRPPPPARGCHPPRPCSRCSSTAPCTPCNACPCSALWLGCRHLDIAARPAGRGRDAALGPAQCLGRPHRHRCATAGWGAGGPGLLCAAYLPGCLPECIANTLTRCISAPPHLPNPRPCPPRPTRPAGTLLHPLPAARSGHERCLARAQSGVCAGGPGGSCV